jgi:hypothetical protein
LKEEFEQRLLRESAHNIHFGSSGTVAESTSGVSPACDSIDHHPCLDELVAALQETILHSSHLHVQDQALLATAHFVSQLNAAFERDLSSILDTVHSDACDMSFYNQVIDNMSTEKAALLLDVEGLQSQLLNRKLNELGESAVVDGQVFSAMKTQIEEKTEEIRLLNERLIIVASTFCKDNECYREEIRQLTIEHEKLRAEMLLNRTKELEALKIDLESIIVDKNNTIDVLTLANKDLAERHKSLEAEFSSHLLAHESENCALLSDNAALALEKCKLENENAVLKKTCQDISSDIVDKAVIWSLKDNRRVDDSGTHDMYQFEIDNRDEKIVYCISKLTSMFSECYHSLQKLERDSSILPHKLNFAELKCARLIESQVPIAANLARKDSELISMNAKLKSLLHEVESYSCKCDLLEKKCTDLEHESELQKKTFEACIIQLEA